MMRDNINGMYQCDDVTKSTNENSKQFYKSPSLASSRSNLSSKSIGICRKSVPKNFI